MGQIRTAVGPHWKEYQSVISVTTKCDAMSAYNVTKDKHMQRKYDWSQN